MSTNRWSSTTARGAAKEPDARCVGDRRPGPAAEVVRRTVRGVRGPRAVGVGWTRRPESTHRRTPRDRRRRQPPAAALGESGDSASRVQPESSRPAGPARSAEWTSPAAARADQGQHEDRDEAHAGPDAPRLRRFRWDQRTAGRVSTDGYCAELWIVMAVSVPGELGQGRRQVRYVEGLHRDPQPVTRLDRGAGREDLDVDRRDRTLGQRLLGRLGERVERLDQLAVEVAGRASCPAPGAR